MGERNLVYTTHKLQFTSVKKKKKKEKDAHKELVSRETKRRVEEGLERWAGTCPFDRAETLLRFVAFGIFLSRFRPSPFCPLFSKRNRYLLSVYLHCWHDESAEITRISFPSSGERLPASLVISCRLAIAGFRSLSPGSLGVISGKLFRGSS